MPAVEFGLTSGSTYFTEIKRIEDLGFDAMWCGEHVFFYVPTLDVAPVLAAWAAQTTRIKVGSGITLLPLRPAAVTAKTFATLDIISGGRVIMGIGVGGEYPKEFDACGVPVKERGARTNESLEIIKKLWTGEEVTHQGRFWNFGPVKLQPPPVQPGGPPIWVSGRSEAALKRAAKYGDAFLPYLYSVDRFRKSGEQLRDLATQAGRDPGQIQMGSLLEICVADTYEQAHQAAADSLSRTYQQDFDKIVDRVSALGTPEQCAEQIAAYVEAGCSHFIFRPHPTTKRDWWGQVEAIAQEIIPRFR